jgi:hypothetical protein
MGETPIAFITGDSSTEPECQVGPVEAAAPFLFLELFPEGFLYCITVLSDPPPARITPLSR